jgi:hypothetical protein
MRTFILRHDSELSHAYAKVAFESCVKHSLHCEYFEGFCNVSIYDVCRQLNLYPMPASSPAINVLSSKNKAALCTISHVAIWKKIVDENIDQAIILEHDAIILDNINFEIPDNTIVALGYKINDPNRYTKPNISRVLTPISGIQGSHAYALTNQTAAKLLDGIKSRGTAGCIDVHVMQSNKFRNGVNMVIADPIAALGWVRKSTIWNNAVITSNNNLLNSFRNNLK